MCIVAQDILLFSFRPSNRMVWVLWVMLLIYIKYICQSVSKPNAITVWCSINSCTRVLWAMWNTDGAAIPLRNDTPCESQIIRFLALNCDLSKDFDNTVSLLAWKDHFYTAMDDRTKIWYKVYRNWWKCILSCAVLVFYKIGIDWLHIIIVLSTQKLNVCTISSLLT